MEDDAKILLSRAKKHLDTLLEFLEVEATSQEDIDEVEDLIENIETHLSE